SLVHALGKLQRKDELRALLDRWSRLPQNPALRAAAVRGAVWLGDLDLALAEAQKNAAQATDPSPLVDLAIVQFSRREFAASEATLRVAIRDFAQHTRPRVLLAWPLNAQGKHREATRIIDAFYHSSASLPAWEAHLSRARADLPWDPFTMWSEAQQLLASDGEVAGTLAAAFALIGDLPHARALAMLARPKTPDREAAEAMLAWRAGDAAAAMARLKALDAVEPTPEWSLPPSFLLAEVASASGEDVTVLDAARRFRSVWAHLGSYGGWTVPRMTFLEALSLSRLGRVPDARVLVDRLLAEEANADSSDALVRDLTTLKAHLELTPPR
ncbi:MAG TPA: hypothetical protein VF805_00510, partial [Anaeromyxobacteraceae bacterium]